MRNIILLPFAFFICGIILYFKINYILLSAVLTALFLIFFYKKSKAFTLFCTVFLITGLLSAGINTRINNNKYKKLTDTSLFSGTIIQKEGNQYTLNNLKGKYKIKFSVYGKIDIRPGDYVTFTGQIQNMPDYKRRLINIYGIDAWVSCSEGSLSVTRKNNIFAIPYKIKYKITSALNRIDVEGGAFISGLICGYTADISQNDMDNFKKLGISHILAVSGFNLAVIYYFASLVLSKVNKKVKLPILLLICFIYSVICGFEPSITRAFIMISIAALAGFTDKPYNVINSIILTAFLMLCWNALYIFNIGFLLSFAAASGIVLFNKDISEKIPERFEKIKDETAVTLSAFISTLPLIMYYNGYFSFLTILVNFIIAPLVSIVTVIGFISALIFLVTSLDIVLYPVTFCGIIFIRIVQVFSRITLLIFTGRPAVLFIILYYILMLIIFKYLQINIQKKFKPYVYSVIIVVMLLLFFYKSSDLKVHFINVGQGDCILIETPKRQTILVDTGPGFGDNIAARDKVIPYINQLGYNKIDMLFISHFHNDHAGGLSYLIKNYKIKYLFSYEIPEEYKNVFSKLSEGDKIVIDNITINILYPGENESAKGDENETGLVMEVRYNDFNVLLTADVDKNVMDNISGSYDILKVPHHGSINSLSEKMLSNSQIGTAVISVGKNNFGHPSKIVISELEDEGVKLYRTDLQGNIIVRTNGERYIVNTQSE